MYILIFNIDNRLILSTTNSGYICGYATLREVLDDFAPFKQKWVADYESYISATICMMNTQPLAVSWEGSPGDMKQYILDGTIKAYSGLGFHKYTGCEVSSSLLDKRETISIWKESMIEAGIANPMESMIIDPFPFTL